MTCIVLPQWKYNMLLRRRRENIDYGYEDRRFSLSAQFVDKFEPHAEQCTLDWRSKPGLRCFSQARAAITVRSPSFVQLSLATNYKRITSNK